MIFFPAIDLKDGQCVRLLRGNINDSTVFNDDVGAQSKHFEDLGCEWLHVVDLNGAFSGESMNGDAVTKILDTVDIPLQLGGGIRDIHSIYYWLKAGIRRVILGTVALSNTDLVIEACKEFPNQIAVGIDAYNGFVAVEGWVELSKISAFDLAYRYEEAGVAAIIYTDISRDGAMGGPNIKATISLANAISTPVIASGGVSSMSDLKSLKDAGNNLLEGVISGRAIYEGKICPEVATAFLRD